MVVHSHAQASPNALRSHGYEHTFFNSVSNGGEQVAANMPQPRSFKHYASVTFVNMPTNYSWVQTWMKLDERGFVVEVRLQNQLTCQVSVVKVFGQHDYFSV